MLTEEEITKKLLSYQVAHVFQLMECLKIRNRVIDASDTGTGKTYCAIALCALLKLTPLIVCPKSVITNWTSVAKEFRIKCLGISNYEMLKNGNYYTENYEKVKCPYMDIEGRIETQKDIAKEEEDFINIDVKQDIEKAIRKMEKEQTPFINKKKVEYKFYLPSDCLVIFDEAHRCKNWSSATSSMLLSMSKSECKIMMLSATLTDKIDCFKPFGVVLNFYKSLEEYKPWIRSKEIIGAIKYKSYSEEQKRLDIIHSAVFPQYGSRLKISELGNLFPSNNITSNAYYLENHEQIDELYKEINHEMKLLKDREDKTGMPLAQLILIRMRIEMLKVTLFMDLAQEGIDSNYSVVIFVNYISTLEYLCHSLKVDCIIKGGQSIEERQSMIDDFQSNKKKVIIVMQQAGGVGISLHDIHGGHPRMSIISPSWAGYELKQTLGRIHRAGSKTPAIQKIVYVAKTYEERICEIIQTKLRNIDAINDGTLDDVVLDKIEMEEDKIKNNIDNIDNIDNNNNKDENLLPKKKYKKRISKKDK